MEIKKSCMLSLAVLAGLALGGATVHADNVNNASAPVEQQVTSQQPSVNTTNIQATTQMATDVQSQNEDVNNTPSVNQAAAQNNVAAVQGNATDQQQNMTVNQQQPTTKQSLAAYWHMGSGNWQLVNGQWHYYYEDGSQPVNEVVETSDNNYYYFDQNSNYIHNYIGWRQLPSEDGYSQWIYFTDNAGHLAGDDWVWTNDGWYFFDNGVMYNMGRIVDNKGRWYYFDSTGNYLHPNGWIQDEFGLWYYANPDGTLALNWKWINGSWYYFINHGKPIATMAVNGFTLDNHNNGYYFDNNGHYYQNTWIQDEEGDWFYAGADGILETGWQFINGHWYHFGDYPIADTNWQLINGKWYYFDPTNAWMDTGWQYINGHWYYLDDSGAMVTGHQLVDGRYSNFDASGAWLGYAD